MVSAAVEFRERFIALRYGPFYSYYNKICSLVEKVTTFSLNGDSARLTPFYYTITVFAGLLRASFYFAMLSLNDYFNSSNALRVLFFSGSLGAACGKLYFLRTLTLFKRPRIYSDASLVFPSSGSLTSISGSIL